MYSIGEKKISNNLPNLDPIKDATFIQGKSILPKTHYRVKNPKIFS